MVAAAIPRKAHLPQDYDIREMAAVYPEFAGIRYLDDGSAGQWVSESGWTALPVVVKDFAGLVECRQDTVLSSE